MGKKVKVLSWVNAGIFPASVLLSVGFSYTELSLLLKKKKAAAWLKGISEDKILIESGNFFALKRTIHDAKCGSVTYFYLIINEVFKFTDYEYCKLAHEVLHICQFLLPDILDRDREFECEAYLHTHLMTQCLKAIRGDR